MMQPLISVLIPAYNHELYVEECLNSISVQTYKNIEIILIDDGSTDNTFKVAKLWFEKNSIPYQLITQNNHGICDTLNKMISLSNGEFLAICASDDRLSPMSLEKRLNYLLENSDKDVVFTDAYLIDSNSKTFSKSAFNSLFHIPSSFFEKRDPNNILVYQWCIPGPVTLIRKNFYTQYQYDTNKLAEDRHFYLHAMMLKKIIYCPYKSAYYRVHSLAITRSARRKMVLLDIAKTNIEYSNKFSRCKKLFLRSFYIDYFLLKNGKIAYPFYIVFKAIRKILVMMFVR